MVTRWWMVLVYCLILKSNNYYSIKYERNVQIKAWSLMIILPLSSNRGSWSLKQVIKQYTNLWTLFYASSETWMKLAQLPWLPAIRNPFRSLLRGRSGGRICCSQKRQHLKMSPQLNKLLACQCVTEQDVILNVLHVVNGHIWNKQTSVGRTFHRKSEGKSGVETDAQIYRVELFFFVLKLV